MSAAAVIERYPTPLPVPFSKAVRAGDFLFLAGVLAMDAQGNSSRATFRFRPRWCSSASRRRWPNVVRRWRKW